jgi:8-oxo-dGTP pyrophosphatase MutT (NUDIX family)
MYSPFHLETWFRKVEGSELIFRRKYLINGMFIGKYAYYLRSLTECFRYFELTPFYTHEYSDSHTFYEWIPKKAQENMERRAVTLIIRRILGDPYFEW